MHQGGSLARRGRADDAKARMLIDLVNQLRDKRVIVYLRTANPERQQRLDCRRPRNEVEEVGGAEDVVSSGAEVASHLEIEPGTQVRLVNLREPVVLPVPELLEDLRANPTETGAVGAAEPLEPATGDGVNTRGGGIDDASTDSLRAIQHEEHTSGSAHRCQARYVDHLPGEREHPTGAEQPAFRRQLPSQVFRGEGPATRSDFANGHPPFLKPQPGHDGGGKLAPHDDDLVTGAPLEAMGE